ncbi:hypothetical protein AGMMS49990_06410 [Endomicrobiia bacterium]|nr:hypothetical protein AGMMS49990_06410 [Endomicrobiia bacterium]
MKKILISFGVAIILSMQFAILTTQRKHSKELKELLELKKDTIPSKELSKELLELKNTIPAFREAIVDPNGAGMLKLMMKNANVPQQHVNILYQIEKMISV